MNLRGKKIQLIIGIFTCLVVSILSYAEIATQPTSDKKIAVENQETESRLSKWFPLEMNPKKLN